MDVKLKTAATMSADELAALANYAQVHGRTWKDALRTAWLASSEPGILQALRNDRAFGPRGLDAFTFPPAPKNSVEGDILAMFKRYPADVAKQVQYLGGVISTLAARVTQLEAVVAAR